MSSVDGVASLAWTWRAGSTVSALGLRSRGFFFSATTTSGVGGSGGGGSTTFGLFTDPFGRPLDFAVGASINGGVSAGMFSGASIISVAASLFSSDEISIVILIYVNILIKGNLETDAALKKSHRDTLVVHKLKIKVPSTDIPESHPAVIRRSTFNYHAERLRDGNDA